MAFLSLNLLLIIYNFLDFDMSYTSLFLGQRSHLSLTEGLKRIRDQLEGEEKEKRTEKGKKREMKCLMTCHTSPLKSSKGE